MAATAPGKEEGHMSHNWTNVWTNALGRGLRAAMLTGAAMMLIQGAELAISAPAAAAKTQPLTQDTVKQFIASFPAVKTIAISHAAEKGQAITSTKDNLAAVIEAVTDKSVAERVSKAVKAHGFKDAKEWAAVGQSVGQVYVHLKVGAGDAKAKKKLDKALAKIEKNDFLNDKQKEQLTKALRGGAESAMAPPPEENVSAVRPMVAELEAAVK